jgi:hypothetical protein
MARFGEYFTKEFSSVPYEKDAKNTKKATKYVLTFFQEEKIYEEEILRRSG